MSHYAKVLNGTVTQVIVASPEFFETFVDTTPGTWIETSYNTVRNTHALGGTPLRGNFAGVGFVYDHTNDVFYPQKPYASWTLDTASWSWCAPVAKPQDGKPYLWDEATTSWIEDTIGN